MSRIFDLVVRGGTVIDGMGGDAFSADIAVKGGRIAAVGQIRETGAIEIDAAGLLVTPGFIDIHTHYDGQATWSDRLTPSSLHGVTTVVMGNCGVGFAPCRAEDRNCLVDLMAGVEDVPEAVMAEGLRWDWESFPQYLDAVARRRHDVEIAAMVPHAALRVYVMGARALAREPATPADVDDMAVLLREAMAAGAIGLGTSRALQHRGRSGATIPSAAADEAELLGLLQVVAEARGIFQINSNMGEAAQAERDFQILRRLCSATGVPISYSLFQKHRDPEGWRAALRLSEQACADGLPIRAQVLGRPTGVLLGHRLSMTPFDDCSTYAAIATWPVNEKLSALRQPAIREAIVLEAGATEQARYHHMFEVADDIDYEPCPEASLAAIAAGRGVPPAEIAYDILIEGNGDGILLEAIQNYAGGSLDACYDMMKSPHVLLGLADGGAHYGLICDASYPTTMLAHWTRDRPRGPTFDLPGMVRRLTSANAEAVRLRDRGRIAYGYRADLNIIDYDRLRLRRPEILFDLPAGGRRIGQQADGYVATVVGGRVTYKDGEPSGALPGRLVRGPQLAPSP